MVSFFPDFCPPTIPEVGDEDSKTGGVDTDADREYVDEDEEDLLEGGGEYIFVIDRSGSMSGNRIRMACDACELFLKSLPKQSKFNIVSFGSNYSEMFKGSQSYSEKNLNNAVKKLKTFNADMGGTEIYAPLDFIYKKKPEPAYPRNIFLLTDGGVSSPGNVINLVGKNVSSARCHSFGIGSGASRELVKKTAIAGKGSYQFINDGETNMNAKVIASLNRAVKPAFADLKAHFGKHGLVQGPSTIPMVFHD